MSAQEIGTVVIGGSQAGLAVGHHLRRRRLPFVIVDENDRIGDAWRKRWDSLRLFTPGRYNGLPGKRYPGSPSSYPTEDEIADYLEARSRVRAACANRRLVGGVGRDAEHIVDHLASRRPPRREVRGQSCA